MKQPTKKKMNWYLSLYRSAQQKRGELQRGGIHSSGFLIFHGPVHFEPPLLIINEQPSGDVSAESRSKPPEKNYVLTRNHKFYLMMRSIFASANASDILEKSQSIDATFFAGPEFIHKCTKEYSAEKLQVIVNELKPKGIVIAGGKALDVMRRAYKIPHLEIGDSLSAGDPRGFDLPILRVAHFTGRGCTEDHFEKSIKSLRDFVETLR